MKNIFATTGLSLLLALNTQAQSTNLLNNTGMIPPGKLAVFKAGTPNTNFNISVSKVQPCFVQIYDPATTNQMSPLLSMALPTNAPNGIWINDHAGSEGGGISRTASREFLALEGYTGNMVLQQSTKPSSDPTVNRGLGTLDAFGNEQVIYQDLANWFGMPPGVTQNNPTGIASTDGTNFWGTGNVTGTSQEAAGTLFFNINESSQPLELQNYIQAAAEARIIGGALYIVVPGQGVYNFVDPENNDAIVPLPLDPNVPNPVEHLVLTNLFINWGSTYKNIANFDMNSQGTLAYGADQTYGIVKFTNNSGNWQPASYYFNTTNIGTSKQKATTQGCFGICVDFSGTNPIIYATTMETGTSPVNNAQGNPNQNRLIRIVDTGIAPGTNVVAQTLATASTTNETFRGIDFGPDLRPMIDAQPVNYATTTNNGSASFSVTADSVYPLSYQWLQNASPLPGQTNSTLQLNGITTTNLNGYDYVCVVTNQYGAATSAIAVLIVTTTNVPPAVATTPVNVSGFVGANVTFAAINPTGTQPFTYQWYFATNGASAATQLADDGVNIYGSQTDSLSVSNLTVGDSGDYYLVVSNAGGCSSNLVDLLTVTYHPATIPSGEPISVTTFVGDTATLSIPGAGGTRPLTNQWYKGSNALTDGNEISGSGTATLNINPASLSDAGSYYVVISNPAGSITSSVATVSVLIPPPLSYVAYSNQVYFQNFNSLPDPGSNSVNSFNNPMDAGSIVTATSTNIYSLANPFDFAYPIINQSFVGGLGLSNTMAGWYGAADTLYIGVDGISRFGAQDGDQTTGGVIDFGPNDTNGPTGTNRALGLLSTGSTGSTTFALKLVNTSGTNLSYISMAFIGELWHNGTGSRTMSFGYTIDSTATNFTLTAQSISNSTYIPALAFSFPTNIEVTPMDGTQPANQTNLAVTNIALSSEWPVNGALWLIWSINYYGAGSGNGYAIDNLSFSAAATLAPQPTAPVLGSVSYTPIVGSGSNATGGLGFSFTNVPSAHFSVYATTNLSSTNWIYLGSATENPLSGYSSYSFRDNTTATNSQRFYKVTSP